MRIFILGFCAIVCLASCQEEVFLDLNTTENIPVIEAQWTNFPGYSFVQIKFSQNFYDTAFASTVSSAQVFIKNLQSGKIVNFRYSPQHQKYLPVNNQYGTIGQNYELHVNIDGKVFESRGEILAPPILDSITYTYRDARLFREEGYYLTLFGKIPFIEDNNYRIKLVRNDTLLNRRGDYLLFDDTFGTRLLQNGLTLDGFPFAKGDKVRLEMYRLNRPAYDYLRELVNLLFNDGGLFSPPPQNPPSNIKSKDGVSPVLGYFNASPIIVKSLEIAPGGS
jgi:hypothetical protein